MFETTICRNMLKRDDCKEETHYTVLIHIEQGMTMKFKLTIQVLET